LILPLSLRQVRGGEPNVHPQEKSLLEDDGEESACSRATRSEDSYSLGDESTVVLDDVRYDDGHLQLLRSSSSVASTCPSIAESAEDGCASGRASAAAAAASATPDLQRKGVTFGTVQVREHPIILGDNPSVSSGPPITISWNHDPATVATLPLDEYESSRHTLQRRRHLEKKRQNQMKVPHVVREELLREAGHTRREMKRATREADAIKEKRLRSALQGSVAMKLEEMGQSLERLVPSVRRHRLRWQKRRQRQRRRQRRREDSHRKVKKISNS